MNGEEWDVVDNVSQSITVGGEYRFEIVHFKGCPDYGRERKGSYTEYWEVSTPSDYDCFDVASSRTSHEDAVRQMEMFIADANLALEALKGMA